MRVLSNTQNVYIPHGQFGVYSADAQESSMSFVKKSIESFNQRGKSPKKGSRMTKPKRQKSPEPTPIPQEETSGDQPSHTNLTETLSDELATMKSKLARLHSGNRTQGASSSRGGRASADGSSSKQVEDLKARLAKAENNLRGSNDMIDALKRSMRILEQNCEQLMVANQEMKAKVEGASSREDELLGIIKRLEEELQQQKELHNDTARQASKLLEDHNRLQREHSALLSDMKVKDEMLGFIQAELVDVAESSETVLGEYQELVEVVNQLQASQSIAEEEEEEEKEGNGGASLPPIASTSKGPTSKTLQCLTSLTHMSPRLSPKGSPCRVSPSRRFSLLGSVELQGGAFLESVGANLAGGKSDMLPQPSPDSPLNLSETLDSSPYPQRPPHIALGSSQSDEAHLDMPLGNGTLGGLLTCHQLSSWGTSSYDPSFHSSPPMSLTMSDTSSPHAADCGPLGSEGGADVLVAMDEVGVTTLSSPQRLSPFSKDYDQELKDMLRELDVALGTVS